MCHNSGMSKKPKGTCAQIDDIVERFLRGETQSDVARAWGVSRQRVHQVKSYADALGLIKKMRDGRVKAKPLARYAER